jgi:hypothetical protein
MRASAIGCEKVSVPFGAEGSSDGSPSAMRLALPASTPRTCSSFNCASRAVRSEISSDAGCCPYG